jgi:hypothetical protein
MLMQLDMFGKPISPPPGAPSLVPPTSGQEHCNQHGTIPNPYKAATSTTEQKNHVMPHRFDPLKAGSTNSTRNRGVEIFNVFAEASKKFPKFEDIDPDQKGFNLKAIGENFCQFLLNLQYKDKDQNECYYAPGSLPQFFSGWKNELAGQPMLEEFFTHPNNTNCLDNMWHDLKARAVSAAFDRGDHEQMHKNYLCRSVAIDFAMFNIRSPRNNNGSDGWKDL